jgi:hypothetical protein
VTGHATPAWLLRELAIDVHDRIGAVGRRW